MKELKDYSVLDIEAIDDERAKDAKPGQIINCTRVYIKSEADKVIAELKDKLRHYPIMAAIIEADRKELDRLRKERNHQKYKRCIDKAELWLERYENSTDEVNKEVSLERHKKWLELAEKFKTN